LPVTVGDVGDTADRATRPATRPLGKALRGVRGLLLDLDGVLVLADRAIPGAPEALAELAQRGLPYRIITNTSLVSRATLAEAGAGLGMPIPAERFASALSVTAAFTARRYPGRPLFVLTSPDARTEFAGQRLLSAEEASAPGADVAAVVIGDAPEELTRPNLNLAFRLVRNGASLIGMHRNLWWLTPDGPTLDAGAFLVGIEQAARVRARILGKPSPAFFIQVAADLASEIRARDARRTVRRSELAMVGDDVWNDVLAARRTGLRGIFVLSGKHGAAELEEAASRRRGGGRPDAIAGSLVDVVAALD
jgi:HAD superfamily hydrolase (TIGR01450 family)